MSFKADLEFSGKTYEVLHCSYAFRRDVDAKGRPSSGVYGGTIQLEVASTEDTKIIEAMLNSKHKPTAGSVKFYKREEDGAVMKKLEFKDAYVIQYSESLDSVGSNPMTINFVLSAREVKIGTADHNNEWPDKA